MRTSPLVSAKTTPLSSPVDGLPGPMFADLDPDPVQVDVAVGLDLHLAAAVAALREDPGRCGDLSVGRLWSRRLGDGCGARTPEAWPGRVVPDGAVALELIGGG